MELFDVKSIGRNVLQIRENYYHSWNKANLYLIREGQSSVLIDTGIGIYDPIEFLLKNGVVNQRPKLAIATHVHFDHCAGHKFFDNFAIHHLDAKGLQSADELQTFAHVDVQCEILSFPPHWAPSDKYKMESRSNIQRPLNDGDKVPLDIADSFLEIVHLPGHTPGSIGVLYPKVFTKKGHVFSLDSFLHFLGFQEKILFSGDMLLDHMPMIDHYQGQSCRSDFKASMLKLQGLINHGKVLFSLLFPCVVTK